ncbi:Calcium-independent receptor for alpha-latrotoxin [Carabus blaptoides fortunei]
MLRTGIFLVSAIYLVNAVLSEDFNITACQHKSLILQCHPGQIVHIVNAKYGRDTNFKCGFGFNKNCESHLALFRTKALCEGREICTIPVEVKVLDDDPCPYTSKYLQVQYRCDS